MNKVNHIWTQEACFDRNTLSQRSETILCYSLSFITFFQSSIQNLLTNPSRFRNGCWSSPDTHIGRSSESS